LKALRLSAVFLLALSSGVAASRPAISDAGRKALSRFLRAGVARGDAPAVVAIVAGPDSILYVGAFGKQSVAANVDATPATIFRIASMTKPVTALAAMMLVEAGTIELDDPVTKYLPDFKQPPVLTHLDENGTVESRPASRAIAIRDLLTNTSGIGYAFSDPSLARLNAAETPDAELPLLHDPGAKWTYGSSTGVLGRVIERTSGKTLDAFFKSRIFDPLGMKDTFYIVPADKHDRVVTQHATEPGGVRSERGGPTSAVHAAQEDVARLAPDTEFMPPRQIAVEQTPHGAKPHPRKRWGAHPRGKSDARTVRARRVHRNWPVKLGCFAQKFRAGPRGIVSRCVRSLDTLAGVAHGFVRRSSKRGQHGERTGAQGPAVLDPLRTARERLESECR
jgi:CubicO group peptidase (beta-lactamase class C family)